MSVEVVSEYDRTQAALHTLFHACLLLTDTEIDDKRLVDFRRQFYPEGEPRRDSAPFPCPHQRVARLGSGLAELAQSGAVDFPTVTSILDTLKGTPQAGTEFHDIGAIMTGSLVRLATGETSYAPMRIPIPAQSN